MKLKSVYVCSNCGETSPRWMGRCPSCGSWNTMNEDVVAEAPKAGTPAARQAAAARQEGVTTLTARRLSEISTTEEKSRILTGISELDRVLGGGIVLGGVVLLSGEPGVGKSTMLLQLCGAISNQHSVLYITGEESVRQVKLRAARLKVPQDNIFLAAENDVDEICGLIEKEKPDLVVIDSIQTMRCMDISSSSGTVSQVKESAARLLASSPPRRTLSLFARQLIHLSHDLVKRGRARCGRTAPRGQLPFRDDQLERSAATRDAALDGADRTIAYGRRLFIGKAARADEDQRLALRRRQFEERALQIGKLDLLVLPGRGGEQAIGDEFVPFALEARPPHLAEEQVAKDDEGPSANVRPCLKAIPCRPRLQQRFLHEVVRHVAIARKRTPTGAQLRDDRRKFVFERLVGKLALLRLFGARFEPREQVEKRLR